MNLWRRTYSGTPSPTVKSWQGLLRTQTRRPLRISTTSFYFEATTDPCSPSVHGWYMTLHGGTHAHARTYIRPAWASFQTWSSVQSFRSTVSYLLWPKSQQGSLSIAGRCDDLHWRVGGRAQLLNRAAAGSPASMALLGPLGLSSCPDINIGMVAYGRVPQSCAKAYVRLPSRSRQEAVGQKQCFCLIHLWIHKKSLLLASTRRQVGVSRSNEINVFLKNWQMYGAKWQLFWFEHGIGLFFCEKKKYLFRSVFVSIFF